MTDTAQTPPPQAGQIQIQNVRLEDFERLVYRREIEPASRELVQDLRRLKQGADFIGYSRDVRTRGPLYTRFVSAMLALFADPAFGLSPDGFDQIAAEHAIIDLLFRASAYESSDHLLTLTARTVNVETKQVQADGPAVLKFLLTYSLRSGFSMNYEEVFRKEPKTLFALWAGMLSPLLTIDPVASERREHLLGLHSIFADVSPSGSILPTLSDAYMYTSYGLRADKHDAKRMIHRMIARTMRETSCPIPTDEELQNRRARFDRGDTDLPRLLICCEWFNGMHAMFRCYAPIIRQLRQRFHLIGMSRTLDIDEIGKAEFDEWHPVAQDGMNLAAVMAQVNDLAPDAIYYPSLGMAMWWVCMASVRLAPIQFMTLGHPASSHSDAMDYVLCDDGAIGDASLFTERIVTYPNGSARYVMRSDCDLITPPDRRGAQEVVNVAVPAMLCKLSRPFMETLQVIAHGAKEAGRAVQFHFFVNMIGVNLYQSAREIRGYLPDALIYERQEYDKYLGHLATCDLHLSTFPFGGTNSNIDSMLNAIPVVTLEGLQPHERFDAQMIRRAGLPESLIAKSREEYAAAAIELIVNDDRRDALRDHLRGFDLYREFFGEPWEGQRGAFLNAVSTIFDHHEHFIENSVPVIHTDPTLYPLGYITESELRA